MDIPFFFYGSSTCSVWIVKDRIVGWGSPKIRYFFQMWRDIPSHVIYFRNKMNCDFLSSFTANPVSPPESNVINYDYLVEGEAPKGSWIKFRMGIKDRPIISDITFNYYSSETNDVEKKEMMQDVLELDDIEFLILLNNLGLSIYEEDGIFDPMDKNVLIKDEDDERRKFNFLYYQEYLNYVSRRIENSPEFIRRFLELSGTVIIGNLMKHDRDLQIQVSELLKKWDNYAIINAIKDVLGKLNINLGIKDVSDHRNRFNSDYPSFFMNT